MMRPSRADACRQRAGGVEDAGEIDGDDVVPFVHRELLHRGDVLDTGVIDHDIDAAEGAFGIAHHRLDLPDVAQVGVVIAGDLAQRGDFSPGVAAVAEAIEHQLGACLRQHFGDPKPMPLVEPVTSAVLPSKFILLLLQSGLRQCRSHRTWQ